MQFKMNNTVSITAGGKTYFSKNRILNIKEALTKNLAYSRYMVFSGSGVKIIKETEPIFYNSDISKGLLYAEFSAHLSGEEGRDCIFTSVSLSPDGNTLFNIAEFDGVLKDGDGVFSAAAAVFLDISEGSDAFLFGGENPLTEFFLGIRALSEDICFYEGNVNILGAGFVYDYKKGSPKAAQKQSGDNFLSFTCHASAGASEIIVEIGGRAALRQNMGASNIGITTVQKAASEERKVILPETDIETISSLNVNNVSIAGASKMYGYDKIIKIDNLLNYNAGKEAYLISSPLGDHTAAVMKKEVTVYKAEKNGFLKEIYRVAKNENGQVDIMSGGKLAVFNDTLIVYNITGAEEKRYALDKGLDFKICDEGSSYHFIRNDGTRVFRYRLANGAINLLSSHIFNSAPVLFRNFTMLGAFGDGDIFYGSGAAAIASVQSALKNIILENPGYSKIGFCEGLCYIEVNGQKKLYPLKGGCVYLDSKSEVRVTPTAVFEVNGEKTKVYRYNPVSESVQKLSDGIEAGDILSAAEAGGYLLVLNKEGTVLPYYMNRSGSYIYDGNLTPGAEVKAILRVRKKDFLPSTAVKVVFRAELTS